MNEIENKTMRKLASIQTVAEIAPIKGADAIEHIKINGWWVVDKKGARQVGDKVVYLEIDSWVPVEIAPFLVKGKEPREYQGIKGERLRTVKLRGAISQGLLLTPDDLTLDIGTDMTDVLGIVKWEPPAEFRSADTKGLFPSFIPKTDQERVQNLGRSFYYFLEQNTEPNIDEHVSADVTWEVTEKCEGSSMTLFAKDGEFGICSRNMQLKDDLVGSTFVNVGKEFKDKILSLGRNIALQGELIGPGIQGNIYNLRQHQYRVFDVYDIDDCRYLNPTERQVIVDLIGADGAPVIHHNFKIDFSKDSWKADIIDMADGSTAIEPEMGDLNKRHLREGLVFKANTDVRMSFKSISNQYLIKEA
jgi:RNA ligase (TIGR02306 family)